MSIPRRMEVKCSSCGLSIMSTVFDSINTDYAENVATKIMSGELFDVECPRCKSIWHLEYDMLYHDMKHGAMVWVIHKGSPEYASKVAEVREGLKLPYKTLRIVEDMNALKEKTSCLERNRDDRVIELCKVFAVCNLLEQQPDFKFRNAFYSTLTGKELISIYDEGGKSQYCQLSEDIYEYLQDLYYSSPYAEAFDGNYAIVDYAWAQDTLESLLESVYNTETTEKDEPVISAEKSANTLVCPSCKSELPTDSVFCPYCGCKIDDYVAVKEPVQVKSVSPTVTAKPVSESPSAKPAKSKKSKKIILTIGIITAFLLGGTIFAIPEYKYRQAYNHLENQEYDSAYTAFEKLNGYRDSDEMLDECIYQKACSKAKNNFYTEAINLFETLDGYKDSERKINEVKYKYIQKNKNNDNTLTYEYLKNLKKQDYLDSTEIYDELYEWKVSVFAVNSSEEDETTYKHTISRYDPVIFHIKLTGGTPNASVRIRVTPSFPDGDTDLFIFDEKWEDGETGWYGWTDGLYDYPGYGATGNLQCKFYDDANNLIGSASVRITK